MATDSVEVGDSYLMPESITELNTCQWECSNTSDIRAEREWELNVTVDDLQCHKVVLLVISSIVEQHAAALCRRKAATGTRVFYETTLKTRDPVHVWLNRALGRVPLTATTLMDSDSG